MKSCTSAIKWRRQKKPPVIVGYKPKIIQKVDCFLLNACSGQDVSYQMKELSDALKITSDTITNLQDDGKYGKGGRLLIIINQNNYYRDSVVQHFDAKMNLRESHSTRIISDEGMKFYTSFFN